jgi:hypothetical protein
LHIERPLPLPRQRSDDAPDDDVAEEPNVARVPVPAKPPAAAPQIEKEEVDSDSKSDKGEVAVNRAAVVIGKSAVRWMIVVGWTKRICGALVGLVTMAGMVPWTAVQRKRKAWHEALKQRTPVRELKERDRFWQVAFVIVHVVLLIVLLVATRGHFRLPSL